MNDLQVTLDETLSLAQALERNLDAIAKRDWAESSDLLCLLDSYCFETRRMANELKDIKDYLTGGPDFHDYD